MQLRTIFVHSACKLIRGDRVVNNISIRARCLGWHKRLVLCRRAGGVNLHQMFITWGCVATVKYLAFAVQTQKCAMEQTHAISLYIVVKSTQRLTSARHIRRTSISSANRKTCSDGCSGRVPTSNSNGVAMRRPIGLKSVGPRYGFIRAAQLTSYSFPVIDARICDFSGARHMLNQTNFNACPNGEKMSATVQPFEQRRRT